jgi:hypothetical protein
MSPVKLTHGRESMGWARRQIIPPPSINHSILSVRLVGYILQQFLLLQLKCTIVDVAAVTCIVGKNQLLLM